MCDLLVTTPSLRPPCPSLLCVMHWLVFVYNLVILNALNCELTLHLSVSRSIFSLRSCSKFFLICGKVTFNAVSFVRLKLRLSISLWCSVGGLSLQNVQFLQCNLENCLRRTDTNLLWGVESNDCCRWKCGTKPSHRDPAHFMEKSATNVNDHEMRERSFESRLEKGIQLRCCQHIIVWNWVSGPNH